MHPRRPTADERSMRFVAVLGMAAVILAWTVEVLPAIALVCTGSWSPVIGAADLVAGAGSALRSTYESAADQVSVTISDTAGSGDAWRVDVRRVDGTWNDDVDLWIVRTSDGTGGTVTGGTSYVQVTTSDQTFFSGSDDVSGIACRLRLTGVSIAVPPGSYGTTVWLTVVDI